MSARARLFLIAVMSFAPAGADEPPVQGFVSAALLSAWCTSETALDREACLSYLRGVFDALQAVQSPASASLLSSAQGRAAICIPADAPITELQIVSNRYGIAGDAPANEQGAVFLIKAFRQAFPCPVPSP